MEPVLNRPGLDTKKAFKAFRERQLEVYNIILTDALVNAMNYVEGELSHYSSTHRVMNELAAFCHQCDNWSARAWFDFPLEKNDPWIGADRVRTIKK